MSGYPDTIDGVSSQADIVAQNVAPVPYTGLHWLDTSATPAVLKIYVNGQWATIAGGSAGGKITSSLTPPGTGPGETAPKSGDLWFDLNTGRLQAYKMGVWGNYYLDSSMLAASAVSAGMADAGKIPVLDAQGRIDPSLISIPGGMHYVGGIDLVSPSPGTPHKSGDFYIATATGTVDASWPGVAGQKVQAGDAVMYDGTKWATFQSDLDMTLVLPLLGGTMAGPLILSRDPATAFEAATKGYVDSANVTQDANITAERTRALAAEAQIQVTSDATYATIADFNTYKNSVTSNNATKAELTQATADEVTRADAKYETKAEALTAMGAEVARADATYETKADAALHTTKVEAATETARVNSTFETKADALAATAAEVARADAKYETQAAATAAMSAEVARADAAYETKAAATTAHAAEVTRADNKYVPKTDLVEVSTGVAQTGKVPKGNALGKIDASWLSIPGGMTFKGTVLPTASAPPTPSTGDFYIFSADGTPAGWTGISTALKTGEAALYDGTKWNVMASGTDLTSTYTKTEANTLFMGLALWGTENARINNAFTALTTSLAAAQAAATKANTDLATEAATARAAEAKALADAKTYVNGKSYATEAWVLAKNYLTSVDLGAYETAAQAGAKYAPKADVATQTWVKAQGYGTGSSIPAGTYLTKAQADTYYATLASVSAAATQAWVVGRGYLTATSLLSYSTTAQADAKYATQAWVTGNNYATQTWVTTTLAAATARTATVNKVPIGIGTDGKIDPSWLPAPKATPSAIGMTPVGYVKFDYPGGKDNPLQLIGPGLGIFAGCTSSRPAGHQDTITFNYTGKNQLLFVPQGGVHQNLLDTMSIGIAAQTNNSVTIVGWQPASGRTTGSYMVAYEFN